MKRLQTGLANAESDVSESNLISQVTISVSVVILFHDSSPFLQEAIDSVFAQTYVNWEILLIDDGAGEESLDVAKRCARANPERVRILAHEGRQNRGVSASRNLGLAQARGKYVCFLDSDDVYLPNKLETECRVMESHPEATAVCGSFKYWFSWEKGQADDADDFVVTLGVRPGQLYSPPALVTHNLRFAGRKPGTSGIMIRRECMPGDACDDSFIGLGDDQVFWTKLSLAGPIFVTDECMFKYRQHPGSLCATAMKSGADLIAWQTFLTWLDNYVKDLKINDTALSHALRRTRRNIAIQIKIAPIKLLYRRLIPLRIRYSMRDLWINVHRNG